VARGVLSRRPGMSAREHRARSWETVGIDLEMASRLSREHARLQPCADGPRVQTASDVLDLAERARLMRRIAAYYGTCYAASPDQLLWAGFAAIAVNDGVRPATDLAMTIAELTRRAGALAPLLRARLRSFAWSRRRYQVRIRDKHAIFADLGWVHMVFLEEGSKRCASSAKKARSAELLSGFETSHAGRAWGDAGHRAIVRGNPRCSVTSRKHRRHRSSRDIGSGRHRNGCGAHQRAEPQARRARNVARAQSRLDGRELRRGQLRSLPEAMAVARESCMGAGRRAASGPARARLPAPGCRGHPRDRGSPRAPICVAVAPRRQPRESRWPANPRRVACQGSLLRSAES
jgi:hypothetical protein